MSNESCGRQPRRGDVVVAAPFGDNCVSGEVLGFRSGRVTIKTADHGNLTLPMHRLTWKPKARRWVCWPGDMMKALEALDRADDALARMRFGIKAEVGDAVIHQGKTGWIGRLVSKPAKATMAPGVTFSIHGGYEIVLSGDTRLTVDKDALMFDSDARVWRVVEM